MPDPSGDDGHYELHIPVDRMIWLIASSAAFGLAGLFIYMYYMRQGQFDDPEDVKYQMFRDEDK